MHATWGRKSGIFVTAASIVLWSAGSDTSSADVSGSVCILGAATAEAEAAVQRIISKYAEETGFNPYEFRGTSIGASRFGHIRLMRRWLLCLSIDATMQRLQESCSVGDIRHVHMENIMKWILLKCDL